MSEEKPDGLFGRFLDRLTHQLEALEEELASGDEGPTTDKGPTGWSMGWKFSLGTPAGHHSRHSAAGPPPGAAGRPGPVEATDTSSRRRSRKVNVESRALAFFEVHEEEDELLVIADLPGLSEDAVAARLVGDDVLEITVDDGTYQDRREILLPAPLRHLEVTQEGPITTIHCRLEKS